MEAEMSGKNEATTKLLFLSDEMVTKETIRICAGLKSTVKKILNDKS